MPKPSILTALAAVLLATVLLAAPAALATETAPDSAEADAVAGAILGDFDRATGKLVQLAEAIPADKYSWRPTEDVRSVSEALMHVVQANYGLSAALGVAPPEDLPEDPEAITDKARVVEMLKASVAQARQALEETGAGDLGEMRQAFGREMPAATVALILLGHNHEHLGQLIAYARANAVVPPWSEG